MHCEHQKHRDIQWGKITRQQMFSFNEAQTRKALTQIITLAPCFLISYLSSIVTRNSDDGDSQRGHIPLNNCRSRRCVRCFFSAEAANAFRSFRSFAWWWNRMSGHKLIHNEIICRCSQPKHSSFVDSATNEQMKSCGRRIHRSTAFRSSIDSNKLIETFEISNFEFYLAEDQNANDKSACRLRRMCRVDSSLCASSNKTSDNNYNKSSFFSPERRQVFAETSVCVCMHARVCLRCVVYRSLKRSKRSEWQSIDVFLLLLFILFVRCDSRRV